MQTFLGHIFMFVVMAVNANIKVFGNFRLAPTEMLQTAWICKPHQAKDKKTLVFSTLSQFLSILPYFSVVLPQIYRSISGFGTHILFSVSSPSWVCNNCLVVFWQFRVTLEIPCLGNFCIWFPTANNKKPISLYNYYLQHLKQSGT